MRGKARRRWWATRLELTVGLAAILIAGWLILTLWDPVFAGPQTSAAVVLSLIAVWVVMVLAFVWMIRILRAPGEEPPPWRNRDR